MKKIIRITTVPISLSGLLTGQLEHMSNYFEMIAISSNKEKLKSYAEDINLRWYEVSLTRKITPLTDLKALYQMYKILRKEKPFVVHSHTPKAGTIGMLAAKLAGVPHRLHTIAGLPLLVATGPKRKLLNLVEKITYSCATMVYPNSHGLKKIVEDLGFAKPEKLKVIGNGSSNGIDTSYFNPELYTQAQNEKLRKSLNIKSKDIVFIFVGRLVADKGINELIRAFKVINKQYDSVKLLLVGSHEKELDPLLPETDKLIENLQDIVAVGWQNDVRSFLALSDYLIFPSHREGFPNVVMQAGAMGLPGIVTDINGCNEIVNHNVNGIVIPVNDEKAIIEAMKVFLENRKVADQMSSKARRMITERYERTLIWKEILEEYKSLEP